MMSHVFPPVNVRSDSVYWTDTKTSLGSFSDSVKAGLQITIQPEGKCVVRCLASQVSQQEKFCIQVLEP